MGFSSQSGQIGFRTQGAGAGTKGTYAPDMGTDGVFLRALGGSLGANRELITTDPEIGGARDVRGHILGPVSYSGEYEFYARMRALCTLFQGAFGINAGGSSNTGVTQGVDLVGTHVFVPQETLPWISIEEAIGVNMEVFNYTDAMVNSLSLEVAPDGYLMGTAGLIAIDQTAGNIKTASPVTDDTPTMVGTSMTVTIDGLSDKCVRSWSMDFTNNIEDDVYCLGSISLNDLTPKRRELTMSATVRPTDINLWREAVYGGVSETSPLSGTAVDIPVNITIDTYAAVGTGVSDVYSLTINLPHCNIQPFEIAPSGDDVIEYDIEFVAIKPLDGTDLATVTIVNDIDVVA